MITQENTSQRPGNILTAIVLTCVFLGLLTYLATSLSDKEVQKSILVTMLAWVKITQYSLW